MFCYRLTISDTDSERYLLHIVGDYFNTYSRLCINGSPVGDVQVESRNLLLVDNLKLKNGDKISIAQIGKDGKILSSTNAPVLASVLTLPAVNYGQVLLKGEDSNLAKQKMKIRMERSLQIFKKEGAKNLILGAYGCGVFQNDPHDVARKSKKSDATK